jgi:FKBP-type peptidyl-prolyl cis-trans isomerase FkpA/FKBP-type peptidyl-prolyl cis-trans isomerase FklB
MTQPNRASASVAGAVAAALLLTAAQTSTAAAANSAKSGATSAPAPGAPTSDDDKTLYALGVLISRNLEAFSLSPAELKIVEQGLTDGANHHPALEAETLSPQIQALQRTRLGAIDEKQKAAGQSYLDKAAAVTGAQKTTSGLVFITVNEGKGASPERTDRVSVNYEGKLIDGTVFDSTAKHGGQPVQMNVTGVIPCWTEALQLMKVGGKARVVCPSSLAYGDRGALPAIMPGATLDFTIELVDVLPKPAAPPAGATAPAPGGANAPK